MSHSLFNRTGGPNAGPISRWPVYLAFAHRATSHRPTSLCGINHFLGDRWKAAKIARYPVADCSAEPEQTG